MKVSVFRRHRDGKETLETLEFQAFLDKLREGAHIKDVLALRDMYDTLEPASIQRRLEALPQVCVAAEYRRVAEGEPAVRTYNGLTALRVENLTNHLEASRIKAQAALLPQTLCALMGADGHSVVILTMATLPDGSLPTEKAQAELFCAQAFRTSVLCYTPSLEQEITIEAPSLRTTFALGFDKDPYVSQHPTPFILEQPTQESIQQLQAATVPNNRLHRMPATDEACITFLTRFNAIYQRTLAEICDWKPANDPARTASMVADACCEAGFPEEETVSQLRSHFYRMNELELRGLVRTIYMDREPGSVSSRVFSKHQLVAMRMKEFMDRRYDIRYNEVLQVTEFRPRKSLFFTFQKLDRRHLNTMHHEACLEGIEPTFNEVKTYVESSQVKPYNPISQYFRELPRWDGHDRIGRLAAMVPNDHPHWERLFRRWFLSMVAYWMQCDNTHANATAPILVGAQGFRKSTYCRLLLPPELQEYFADSIDFRSRVEAQRVLSRFLLVNIDEFDQLNADQSAFVKHLFQKPVNNIRRMYSESIETQRRYASFIGTSNHQQLLNDPTGNRRYLCVQVTAPIRTEEPIEYRQLYAQAKELILKGERYWLNDEDEMLIRQYNRRFEVESPQEQLFYGCFDRADSDEDGEWLRITDIMREMQKQPTFNRRKDMDTLALGRVLTKLDIAKRRDKKGFYYLVKRINNE